MDSHIAEISKAVKIEIKAGMFSDGDVWTKPPLFLSLLVLVMVGVFPPRCQAGMFSNQNWTKSKLCEFVIILVGEFASFILLQCDLFLPLL